jgi:hypothetical protein
MDDQQSNRDSHAQIKGGNLEKLRGKRRDNERVRTTDLMINSKNTVKDRTSAVG